jgi:hypothetical protein
LIAGYLQCHSRSRMRAPGRSGNLAIKERPVAPANLATAEETFV